MIRCVTEIYSPGAAAIKKQAFTPTRNNIRERIKAILKQGKSRINDDNYRN